MKFARILLLLVVVLCLLGSATVDAAKKKKKKSKGKAKVTTDHLESVLNQAEQADKKAKPTPEEAQANLNAAIEKAEKQAEADTRWGELLVSASWPRPRAVSSRVSSA